MVKVKVSSEVVALVGEHMAEMFTFMNPDMILGLAELADWQPADQQQKIESLGAGTRTFFVLTGLVEERTGDPYGDRYVVTDKFQAAADAARKVVDHLGIHRQIRFFIDG